ncbi:MAG: VCBS repeat-containing protein [Planctomycetales bacterium]|nr:VCBS repeat-containing protein [Planctomycetales bacterium]
MSSHVSSGGAVVVTATNDSEIKSKVVMTSASVGIGLPAGVGVSLGAAVARNLIGWTLAGERVGAAVMAYTDQSSISATGNLNLIANSHATIDASVGAGSMAIAAAAPLPVPNAGVAVSGAGAGTENKTGLDVRAYINGSGNGITVGGIQINAADTSTVHAETGSVSVAATLGGLSAALSVGVAVARNTLDNLVEAIIVNANDVTTTTGGIHATADETAMIQSTTFAASAAIGLSLLGIAASNATTTAENNLIGTTRAYVDASHLVSADGVTVLAQDLSIITSKVLSTAIAGGPSSLALGITLSDNTIGGLVTAYVNNSSITADNSGNIQVLATSTPIITTSSVVGAFALSLAGIAAAGGGSEATINRTTESYVDNSNLTAVGNDVIFSATSTGIVAPEVLGLAGGLIGVSGMNSHADINGTTHSFVSGTTSVNANNFNVLARDINVASPSTAVGAGGALTINVANTDMAITRHTQAVVNSGTELTLGGTSFNLNATSNSHGAAKGTSVTFSVISIGVMDLDANLTTNTQALIENGAIVRSNGGDVNVAANSTNVATSEMFKVGVGLALNVGSSTPSATVAGNTQALIGGDLIGTSPGTGAANVNVSAISDDRSAVELRTGGGGLLNVGISAANAFAGSSVTAAVADGRTIGVYGNVTIHSEGKSEADSSSNSGSGGLIEIGVNNARATSTPVVSSLIGNSTVITAGGAISVSSIAPLNPTPPERVNAGNRASAISGDGITAAASASASGGFIAVADTNSYTSVTPTVTTRIGQAARLQANSISLNANGFAASDALTVGASGGFIDVGSVDASLTQFTQVNNLVEPNASLTANNITLLADGNLTSFGKSSANVGGVIAVVTANTQLDVDYKIANTIGDGAILRAGNLLAADAIANVYALSVSDADARGFGSGASSSESSSIPDANDLKGVRIGRTVAETSTTISSNAYLSADTIRLAGRVDSLTASMSAYSYAGGAATDADAVANVDVNDTAKVQIDPGAVLEARLNVDLIARHANLDASAYSEATGASAVGSTDSTGILDVDSRSLVLFDRGARIITHDLTSESSYDVSNYDNWARRSGVFDIGQRIERGDFDTSQATHWLGDVVIQGKFGDRRLVIAEDGSIETNVGMTPIYLGDVLRSVDPGNPTPAETGTIRFVSNVVPRMDGKDGQVATFTSGFLAEPVPTVTFNETPRTFEIVDRRLNAAPLEILPIDLVNAASPQITFDIQFVNAVQLPELVPQPRHVLDLVRNFSPTSLAIQSNGNIVLDSINNPLGNTVISTPKNVSFKHILSHNLDVRAGGSVGIFDVVNETRPLVELTQLTDAGRPTLYVSAGTYVGMSVGSLLRGYSQDGVVQIDNLTAGGKLDVLFLAGKNQRNGGEVSPIIVAKPTLNTYSGSLTTTGAFYSAIGNFISEEPLINYEVFGRTSEPTGALYRLPDADHLGGVNGTILNAEINAYLFFVDYTGRQDLAGIDTANILEPGDINGDGILDLAAVNGSQLAIFVNDSSTGGGLRTVSVLDNGLPIDSIAFGDADNDGDLDLAIQRGGVTAILRNENATFSQNSFLSLPAISDSKGAVLWNDFDNDGQMDLLDSGPQLAIHKFVNGAPVGTIGNFPSGIYTTFDAGDYDLDGDIDILAGGSNRPTKIYRNEGAGIFVDAGITLPKTISGPVKFGDDDGDGDLDILILGSPDEKGNATLSLYENTGDGNFARTYNTTGAIDSMLWFDSDRDADLDILIHYTDGASNLLHFLERALPGVGASDAWAVGDLNGDGNLDLATATGSLLSLFVDDTGAGDFRLVSTLDNGQAISALAFGDGDGDGDQDLAVQRGGLTSILVNQSGSFANATINLSANSVSGAGGTLAWADFNNDGQADLVDIGISKSFIHTFVDGVPVSAYEFFLPTLPDTQLTITDINGDGYLDIGYHGDDGTVAGRTEVLLNQGATTLSFSGTPNGFNVDDIAVPNRYRLQVNTVTDPIYYQAYDQDHFVRQLRDLTDGQKLHAWTSAHLMGNVGVDLVVAGSLGSESSVETFEQSAPLYSLQTPTSPSGVAADVIGNKAVLKWNAPPAPPAKGAEIGFPNSDAPTSPYTYNLRITDYSVLPGTTYEISTPAGRGALSNTQFEIPNLPPGTQYSFTVQAVDASGIRSPWSNVAAFQNTGEIFVNVGGDVSLDVDDGNFDNGQTTLREAINFANTHDGNWTIRFDGNTVASPIVVQPLTITTSLTIGNPNDFSFQNLSIASDGSGRIFTIDDGNAEQLQNVTINGLRLSGGRADRGGAIYSTENLTLDTVTFFDNQATEDGGAAYLDVPENGNVYLRNVSNLYNPQSPNQSPKNSAGRDGGSIAINNAGTVQFATTDFQGSEAVRNGGAISIHNAATGTIRSLGRTHLSSTTAGQDGGGISVVNNGGLIDLSETVGEFGTAGRYGGGLYLENHQGIAVLGNTWGYNSAQLGGAIYVNNDRGSVTNHGLASHNQAQSGGGIYVTQVGGSFVGSFELTFNTALDPNGLGGGGLTFLNSGGILNVNNVQISDNTSASVGGGLAYTGDGTATFDRSSIYSNTARRGAGIDAQVTGGSFGVTSSTLSHNSLIAAAAGGAALNLTLDGGATGSIVANTLGFNDASASATGAALDITTRANSTALLRNTLIAETDLASGSTAYQYHGDPAQLTYDSNLIGNELGLLPLEFRGGRLVTHGLQPGSPAIDAGANPNLLPQFDQRGPGYPRAVGRPDIGSYEQQAPGQRTFVVSTLSGAVDGDISEGQLSLSEAIQLANAAQGLDTITFSPALDGGTIASLLGNLGVTPITDSLRILGPGADKLTVNYVMLAIERENPTANVNVEIADLAFNDLSLTTVENTHLHGLNVARATLTSTPKAGATVTISNSSLDVQYFLVGGSGQSIVENTTIQTVSHLIDVAIQSQSESLTVRNSTLVGRDAAGNLDLTQGGITGPVTVISSIVPFVGAGSTITNSLIIDGDAAGLTAGTSSATVTIDTVAPNQPVILTTEQLTNDATPTISGTAEPNSRIELFVDPDNSAATNNSFTLTTAADNAGNWTVDVPNNRALNSGQRATYIATAIDAAGNASVSATSFVDIDTVAPTAPVAWIPQWANSDPTVFRGFAEPNSLVTLTVATNPTSAFADANGLWSIASPPRFLLPQLSPFSITATDAAGNVSVPTTGSYQFDNSAPQPPFNLSINPQQSTTPTISGLADASRNPAGLNIIVTIDPDDNAATSNSFTLTTTIDAAGNWSVTVPAERALNSGFSYRVFAFATDPAGNTSTTAEATGTVVSGPVSDTIITSESWTNDTSPTITGQSPQGSTLQIKVDIDNDPQTFNSLQFSKFVSDANGYWSVTVQDGLLSDGATIGIAVFDSASSTDPVATGSMTIDTTPPTAPTVDVTQFVNSETPTLAGTAEPNSTVRVILDSDGNAATVNSVTLETTALEDGSWLLTIPAEAGLHSGSHAAVSITSIDRAGNESGATINEFFVNTQVPLAPTLLVAGRVSSGTPILDGYAEPFSTVLLTIDPDQNPATDNNLSLTTNATANGGFAFTLPTALSDGAIAAISATSTNAQGRTSASTSTTFAVDLSAPSAPVASLPAVTNSATPTFTGTAELGSTVTIVLDPDADSNSHNRFSLSAQTDSAGQWSITVPVEHSLANGSSVDVEVFVTDEAGNVSSSTTGSFLVVTSTSPAVNISNITNDITPTIRGVAQPGSQIQILLDPDNDSSTFNSLQFLTVADANGTWNVTVPAANALSQGATVLVVMAQTDASGNLIGSASGSGILDPRFGSPQQLGGGLTSIPLQFGSPAIDAGSNPAGLTTDMRGIGFEREVGSGPDMGAYETQPVVLTVTTAENVDDGNYSAGNLSLLEAIRIANRIPGTDTVRFADNLTDLEINLQDFATTFPATNVLITDSLNIEGRADRSIRLQPDRFHAFGTQRYLFDDGTSHEIDIHISGVTFVGSVDINTNTIRISENLVLDNVDFEGSRFRLESSGNDLTIRNTSLSIVNDFGINVAGAGPDATNVTLKNITIPASNALTGLALSVADASLTLDTILVTSPTHSSETFPNFADRSYLRTDLNKVDLTIGNSDLRSGLYEQRLSGNLISVDLFTPILGATKNVTIRYTDVNDPDNALLLDTAIIDGWGSPTIPTGNVSTQEDTFVDIDLRPYVILSDGAQLISIRDVDNPVNGTVELLSDGFTARFHPAADFNGQAQFEYSVLATPIRVTAHPELGDNVGHFTDTNDPTNANVVLTPLPADSQAIARGIIQVAVSPLDDVFRVVPHAVSAFEDVQLDLDLGQFVTDVDSPLNPLTFTPTGADNATFQSLPDGHTVRLTFAANYFGPATLTFSVTDGQTTYTDQVIPITVTSVNDPPTIALPTENLSIAGNTSYALDTVSVGDVDSSSLNLTLTSSSGSFRLAGVPTFTLELTGSASEINAALSTAEFVPNNNFAGIAKVELSISDGTKHTSTALYVAVQPINPIPQVTLPSDVRTNQDTSVTITGIIVADEDTPSVTVTVSSSVGSIQWDNEQSNSVQRTGSIAQLNTLLQGLVYIPATGYFGSTNVDVAITDGQNSTTAQLNVDVIRTSAPTTITANPHHRNVLAGGQATFSAVATGIPDPTVQWQVSVAGAPFTNIPGATSTTLSLPNLDANSDNNQYRAVFTNASSVAVTDPARLTVISPPVPTVNPQDQLLKVGQTATFTALAYRLLPESAPSTLTGDAQLLPGEFLISPEHGYKLVYQFDGNLVLYRADGVALWTSNTFGKDPGRVVMQSDGNLVIYGPADEVHFASGTSGNPNATLVLQGDGNLVIYDSQFIPRFATNTFETGASPIPTLQWQVSTNGGATFANLPGEVHPSLSFVVTLADQGKQFRALLSNVAAQGVATTAATLTVDLKPSLVVTTLNDEDDGTSDPSFGSGTSLREAIAYANSHSGADTILFDAALGGQTITVGSQLVLTETGSENRTTLVSPVGGLTISGQNITRALQVNAGVAATLDGLTMVDGRADQGGAIVNLGDLDVVNSVFRNNVADSSLGVSGGVGGAISNLGTLHISGSQFAANRGTLGGAINSSDNLTITHTTMSANQADFNGGALRIFGVSTISNSTFDNNHAGNGGGGLINHGDVTITNSTFAYNEAAIGGGIQVFQNLADLRNVTLTANSAVHVGGGIAVNNATVTATNTIIAGNAAVNDRDVWGSLAAASTNNLLNQSATDAGLGTFDNHGGSTRTVALLPNSPAIDAAIGLIGVTSDQRGILRPFGTAPDMGAFESQFPLPTLNPQSQAKYVGDTVTFSALASGLFDGSAPSTMSGGDRLLPGDYLLAPNHGYKLTYQVDGNLVLYRGDGTPLWHSNTFGQAPGEAVMQSDGNFVIYGPSGDVQFQTATSGNPGATLSVQDDGTLVIYGSLSNPLFAVGTPSTDPSVVPTIQWQVSTDDGATFTEIPGAVNLTLSFSVALADHGNQYRARFSNAFANDLVTSTATLSVSERPAVLSFTRQTPSGEATNADSLVFRVTFNNDVQNVDATDFVVSGGTTADITSVTPVSGAGQTVYEITVSGGNLASFNGPIGIDLAPGTDITDLALEALQLDEPLIDETFALDNTAPQVSGEIIIDDGTAQRSMVRSITINFDTNIAFDEGAFDLRSNTGIPIAVTTSVSPGTFTTQVVLTFPTLLGGSLQDGNYRLTLLDSHIRDAAGNSLDGDANDTPGGNHVDEFYRYFGDLDGSGVIDRQTYAFFLRAYSDPDMYDARFDADQDGDIDRRDFAFFKRNYNRPFVS